MPDKLICHFLFGKSYSFQKNCFLDHFLDFFLTFLKNYSAKSEIESSVEKTDDENFCAEFFSGLAVLSIYVRNG